MEFTFLTYDRPEFKKYNYPDRISGKSSVSYANFKRRGHSNKMATNKRNKRDFQYVDT